MPAFTPSSDPGGGAGGPAASSARIDARRCSAAAWNAPTTACAPRGGSSTTTALGTHQRQRHDSIAHSNSRVPRIDHNAITCALRFCLLAAHSVRHALSVRSAERMCALAYSARHNQVRITVRAHKYRDPGWRNAEVVM